MTTSTALVPFEQLNTMAAAFAKSGMFGAKNQEQALSLLLLAQAEGVHPAIAMRDFDIIQGKPSKKAEAMHRSFLAAGGSITWHRLDDEMADASFSHPQGSGGKPVRITWDMERVKKAGLSGKDMYSKFRRQMLRSRCISEGCRTVYPAATSGLYVPDEVVAFAKQPEKDMGAAPIVADEDITQQIPGVGAPAQDATPQANPPAAAPASAPAEAAFRITLEQAIELAGQLHACDPRAEADFCKIAKIAQLDHLPSGDYFEALDWIARRTAKKARTA